jgi:hypothetical protein
MRFQGDSTAQVVPDLPRLRKAAGNLETAKKAAEKIKDAARVVGAAFSELVANGLIDPSSAATQVCPICAQEDPATLTPARAAEIVSWAPALTSLETAEGAWRSAWAERSRRLQDLQTSVRGALPEKPQVTPAELDQVPGDIRTAAQKALKCLDSPKRGDFLVLVDALLAMGADSQPDLSKEARAVEKLQALLPELEAEAATYKDNVDSLEEAVAGYARKDEAYLLSHRWQAAARSVQPQTDELRWARARESAQRTL